MLKSKHRIQSNKLMKNVENKLKEFNNNGRSNLSQQPICALKVIANKR